jgi:hypothetical protein
MEEIEEIEEFSKYDKTPNLGNSFCKSINNKCNKIKKINWVSKSVNFQSNDCKKEKTTQETNYFDHRSFLPTDNSEENITNKNTTSKNKVRKNKTKAIIKKKKNTTNTENETIENIIGKKKKNTFFYERFLLENKKNLLNIPIYSSENGKPFTKDELFCLIGYAIILKRYDFIEFCIQAEKFIQLKEKISLDNRNAFNDMSDNTKEKVEMFFLNCLYGGLSMRRCDLKSNNFKYEVKGTKITNNNIDEIQEFLTSKSSISSSSSFYSEKDEIVINNVGKYILKAKEIYQSLSFVGKNYIDQIKTIEIRNDIDHVQNTNFIETFNKLAFKNNKDENSCMRLASTSFIATSICFLRSIDRLPEKYHNLNPHKMEKIL